MEQETVRRYGRFSTVPTKASRQLDRLLDNGGPVVRTLRAKFHRSQLRSYRNGKRRPELEGMIEIERVTAKTGEPIAVRSWELKHVSRQYRARA